MVINFDAFSFTDRPFEDNVAVPRPSTDHCDYTKKRLTLILEKTRAMHNRLKLLESDTEHADKAGKTVVYSLNRPQLTISPVQSRTKTDGPASFSMPSHMSPSTASALLPQFKCPLCLHGYRSQTLLNDHMRKKHSVLI